MDRNPSPPLADYEEGASNAVVSTHPDEGGDRIGDTVFSKLWVISLLEKVLQVAARTSSHAR